MDLLFLAAVLWVAVWVLKRREQARRIALLGTGLARYQIERHMETVMQGYQRALGEKDPERQQQIWNLMRPSEDALSTQFSRLAEDFAATPELEARVSRLPVCIPYATKLSGATFDMRQALAVHARGISRAVQARAHEAARPAAFKVSAELLLMQHTCHWFCRSKTLASARMLARHQTTYAQLVMAVGEGTRGEYGAVIEGRA